MQIHTNNNRKRAILVALATTTVAVAVTTVALANAVTGPSSSDPPYIVRSEPGVVSKSILTVGDSVNDKPGGAPYRFVGIPDGLGAYDNGDGTFTVLANHELQPTAGIERLHGAKGAFVSKWTIDKETLEVEHGEDLIEDVATWNAGSSTYNAPALGVAMNRLCSADLALKSAFYNPATDRGYDGRIFTSGEEAGDEGRGFGHVLNGTSYELPALGKMSFENIVPHPATGDRTIVTSLDDQANGQVYFYAGDKQTSGNPVERAGLNNGRTYGLKVDGFPAEIPASGIPSGTRFTGFDLGDVRNQSGAALNTASNNAAVTRFQRPEDGAWDPEDPRVFYFVTTASFTERSRLWKLTFDDPADPAAGGTIDMLLDGTEGQRMLDNMTVDGRGRLILQEDPGGQEYLARVWRYDPQSDVLTETAKHSPRFFTTGAGDFLTIDEESSGIIDVSRILGSGWYLADVQAHYAISGELVQGGQLLALHIPAGTR